MIGYTKPNDEELAQLERRVATDPEEPVYLVDLAEAYAERGRWEDAIRVYQAVVTQTPQNPLIFNDLATVYEEIGDTISAEKNYQKALDLEPRLAAAHLNLGLMYKEQDRLAEAISHLSQSLEFSDDPFEIDLSRSELDKLRAAAEKQRRLQIRGSELASNVEGSAISSSHPDRADYVPTDFKADIRRYEEAIAKEPDNALLYNDLATVYEDAGEYSRAEDNYLRALELEPELSLAHLNLGLLYRHQDRIEEAFSHLTQCLELSSNPDEREEARTVLGAFQINWVVVTKTAGRMEGELIAGLLRSEGIPAKVWADGAGGAISLTFGPLGTGQVLVPQFFLERARELLAADIDDQTLGDIADTDLDESYSVDSGEWNTLAGVSWDEMETSVRCPHCNTELELDESEAIQGWYICPECEKKAYV